MESYVEHANISVTDVDESIRFFLTAMPDFRVRLDSGDAADRWVHVGTDHTYVTLNQMPSPAQGQFTHHRPGFNHIGFVVEDTDALRNRMLDAGYKEGYIPAETSPYRKRVYFIDPDGIEYEFVHYLTDDLKKRNN